ncbi:MAG: nucleoside deaminase [Magnetococcales bacterium]|nr:nucleoside deaminase [Magnetococcales bacterium]
MKGEGVALDLDRTHALLALVAAVSAGDRGEVPVGAVLVDGWGRILAEGGNRPVFHHDPLGHAEIIALRLASRRLANYRLAQTEMTVTLQPCPLCLEALKIARISKVSYLAEETRLGGEKRGCVRAVPWKSGMEKGEDDRAVSEFCSRFLRFFFDRKRGI